MNKYLVITIDVEPDCSFDWTYSNPLTFHGVKEGIGKRLQPLFNRFSIVPTYLINNVVLEHQESIDVFKALPGEYELGTHLHPEFIEPQKKYSQYAGKKGEANCCFYEPDIEFEKIKNITNLFIKKFGYSPTSFRAGRFSAGVNTINSLEKLNYKTDTSVTPLIRWDDRTREKSIDFRTAPAQPYWIGKQCINTRSTGKVLEAPVSIAAKKISLANKIKYVIKNKRIPYKGSRPVWLRPAFSNIADFKYVLDTIETQYEHEETIVYNMMFHNVEIMPGLSPYTTTEEDCTRYIQSLEWLFQYCHQHSIKPVGLSALYDIFKK